MKYLPIIPALLLLATDRGSAQVWSNQDSPSTNWYSITMSADGSKLTASDLDGYPDFFGEGYIYMSTNYGSNWSTTQAPYTNWYALAASADGSRVVGVCGGSDYNGGILVSTNYGYSWSPTTAPITNWFTVSMSADGSKIVAGCGGFNGPGGLFHSTDYGSTWAPAMAPNTGWMSVSTSADGQKWVGLAWNDLVYRSTDAGATWAALSGLSTNQWQAIASSADGTKLAAAAYRDYIYLSTNSGANWARALNASSNQWVGIVSSADGSSLLAPVFDGPLLLSTDSGATWNPGGAEIFWQGGAISADAGRLAAIPLFGPINVAQMVYPPKLSVNLANNKAELDWTVPSSAFRLLQTSNLNSANWTAVTNQPMLNTTNLYDQITLTPTNLEFYRLQYP